MPKYLKYAVGVPLSIVVLAVAYYGISPLSRNITLDEASPASALPEEAKADVVGTVGHPASGIAKIIQADGKSYLRYENFKTINGPDLFVYLAKTPDAKEFVNLGVIKATEGNVNYVIPAGIDPRDYPYALVWCRAFGVLFNSAKLY